MKLRDCVATAAYLTNQNEEYETILSYPQDDEESVIDDLLDTEPTSDGNEDSEPPAGEETDSEEPYEGDFDGSESHTRDCDSIRVEKNIEFLIKCANLVITEIANAYLMLKDKEDIETDNDGFVSYTRFRECPTYIFSAKKNGRSVSYKEYPDRIELSEKGRISFEYAYLPRKLTLNDEVPFRCGRPDERTIAYGIAAEYYLINGQSDEAVVWDKRYRDGLHNSQLKRGEARVKARAWV